jgi:hypothetical protein
MARPKAKKRANQTINRKAGKATSKRKAPPGKKKGSAPRPESVIEPRNKTENCVALLVRPEGASLEELQQITGWQPHSVRGFLSGTVKRIPGAALSSEKPPAGARRYHLRRATA